MAKLQRAEAGDELYLHFRCPGCQDTHTVRVKGNGSWGWNGDMDRPTFTPSVLVSGHLYGPEKQRFFDYDGSYPCEMTDTVCHSFVTDGRIQFLADSYHELAGQTVDLPNWE